MTQPASREPRYPRIADMTEEEFADYAERTGIKAQLVKAIRGPLRDRLAEDERLRKELTALKAELEADIRRAKETSDYQRGYQAGYHAASRHKETP